ncbi:MAG: aryl-sulfate sulfotransferase [Nocardioides sp.]
MTPSPRLALLALGTAVLPVPMALTPLPAATGAGPPTHEVAVTTSVGSVSTWPAYAASVPRFALDPTAGNDGSVVVTASTSDPGGVVRIDGRPVASGHHTRLTGLRPGDEISVMIDDRAGHSAQSWIYLPSTFPHLSTTGALTPDSATGSDHVFVTLGNFLTTTPYETVVDGNGVPSWFEQGNGSDLKPVDLGATRYQIARKAAGGGYAIDELDSHFGTIRSHQLDGIPASTDFHDSELLPGGQTLLLGYHGASRNGHGYFDAVIQIVDADGHTTFSWDSKDYVDPSEAYVDGGIGDYAHINSLQYLPNSDILASFRNLGQVMRIAGPDDPDYSTGHVIWRLGGQRNDFTFVDDPYGGNCAQHMVRLLPNGHLMLFDNGSRADPTGPIGPQSADMCPDPQNPGGARIARPQTRIAEYDLDEQAHTATLVWQFVPTDRYAAFAGSQQRLADGDTFVGWAQANDANGQPVVEPVASLVSATPEEVWALYAGGWFSYRAFLGPAPDAVAPTVDVTSPKPATDYVEGQHVVADFGCTDTGGSDLDTCTGSTDDGAALNMKPGRHTLKVTATDVAGNRTTRRVHYHVAARSRPDARVRAASGTWVGDDVYGGWHHQHVAVRQARAGAVRTRVSLQNDGAAADRLLVAGAAGTRHFAVRYRHDGRNVTSEVLAGTLHTGRLGPGATYTLTVVTVRTQSAAPGQKRVFTVRATSRSSARHDTVAVVAHAVR